MSTVSDAFLFAACTALGFLESEHDFALAETMAPPAALSSGSLYMVTYRRVHPSNLFVCLSTAPVRLELDLVLGHGWPPEYPNTMSVSELLAIESPNTHVAFTSGVYESFGDASKMADQYTALARGLRDHGTRFFANAPSIWDDLVQLRQSLLQARKHEEVSRLAEMAFKADDWNRTVELLESLGEHRSRLQASRLAYARNRILK